MSILADVIAKMCHTITSATLKKGNNNSPNSFYGSQILAITSAKIDITSVQNTKVDITSVYTKKIQYLPNTISNGIPSAMNNKNVT